MSNFLNRRSQKCFMAVQSSPLTLPATISGSNYCLTTKTDINLVINPIDRPDITGSRQMLAGIRGRMSGTWGIDCSMAGSGTAGLAPDIDPILQTIFGQAGVGVGSPSTGWQYTMSDNIVTAAIYLFRKLQSGSATNVTQLISMGSLCDTATFSFGSDLATISASGKSCFILDTDNFSTYLTPWKGGLSAMPVEPTTPTYHGLPTIGFTGQITVDGNVMGFIKSGSISVKTGNEIVADNFGSFIANDVMGDTRQIAMSLVFDDTDDAFLANLKQKAFTFTPLNATIQVGTIAGNIWTFALTGIQLAGGKFSDNGKRWQSSFSDSQAHGTTLAGLDALTLTIT